MTDAYQVVYLTGAPAAGKSSVARALVAKVTPLEVFEYGSRLTQFLSERHEGLTQADIRERSAGVASADDIRALDAVLKDFVQSERQRSHVIIDSHAVTKERYGFRVTAYSMTGIASVNPTMICVLYTPSDVTRTRIAASPAGRPMVTEWDADFHTYLQANVALTYAMTLGVPAYFIDGSKGVDEVTQEIADLIRRASVSYPYESVQGQCDRREKAYLSDHAN